MDGMGKPRVLVAAPLAVACVLASCSDDDADLQPADAETATETDTEAEVGCASSPTALADCVTAQGYDADLGFIAEIRNPGSTHWQAVQDLCFDRLTELGYEVEQHEYITGVNIIGRKPGVTNPEQQVLIAAHYDHLPDCLGADDNATGVAGVLEVARAMSQAEFERTITVACWDQEEIGKVGSRQFAQEAQMRGDQFVVNFNFEMIGYVTEEPQTQAFPAGFNFLFPEPFAQLEADAFRGNFIALIGDQAALPFSQSMVRYGDTVGLKSLVLSLDGPQQNLEDLRRSDHASFWDIDVPAIMITDTANFRNLNYHCAQGEDSVERLSSAFSTQVIASTVAAAAEVAGLR